MTKGQLSQEAGRRQEQVENVLALLSRSRRRLAHDMTRVRQARDRTGLKDLLDPVLEDHRTISEDLEQAQKLLRQFWDDGQAARWKKSI